MAIEVPAARIHVDTSQVEAMLKDVASKVDLKGGLGRKIADILRLDALRQFQVGGDPAWTPLSPWTIKEKARLGYPRLNRFGKVPLMATQNGAFGPQNILIRTTALMSSWTNALDLHHVEEITDTSVSIGSDLKYAGTMQKGSDKGWHGSKIPARPINLTDIAQTKIKDLIETELAKGN